MTDAYIANVRDNIYRVRSAKGYIYLLVEQTGYTYCSITWLRKVKVENNISYFKKDTTIILEIGDTLVLCRRDEGDFYCLFTYLGHRHWMRLTHDNDVVHYFSLVYRQVEEMGYV